MDEDKENLIYESSMAILTYLVLLNTKPSFVRLPQQNTVGIYF